jgi:serine phosphatase RsbU (regulator of sigma subunit)
VVAESAQRDRDLGRSPPGRAEALDPIAAAGREVAESSSLGEALDSLARGAAAATRTDVVVVRVRSPGDGRLVARAVSGSSAALTAELEGTLLDATDVPHDEVDSRAELPAPVVAAARRAGATAVLLVPVRRRDEPVATLELLRAGREFDEEERLAARLASTQLALAVQAFEERTEGTLLDRTRALEVLGDALSAGEEQNEAGARLTRIAALATGAASALLWLADDRGPVWVASHGAVDQTAELERLAQEVLADRETVRLDRPRTGDSLATVRLGEPPLGVLQLVFSPDAVPDDDELARLATLGVRAAQSLRAGEHARALALELDRTRALLGVLGQAIAQLSLAHTVETAVAQVAELLGVTRVAVYLREGDRLEAAAERGLAGPHAAVAERLVDLALGAYRARGVIAISNPRTERGLAAVTDALAEAEIDTILAVPLHGQDEVVGLLVAYPPRGRAILPGEASLLPALAAQLAVAVQNARLHERSKRLGSELEHALLSERRAARQLRALSEISGSFVEHLSLERTLEAVAQTVVESFDVDATSVHMVDRRRGELVTRAVHIAPGAPAEPLRTLLSRPQPLTAAPVDISPVSEPTVLDAESAERLGGATELLAPFLAKGSTAAVVPVSTKTELLATLTLLSLDPERPITQETADATRPVAAQAALAIDNARLYQQQKEFADTMQRTLQPSADPRLAGYELGHVYESSARVDVGGDVYDFLRLDDHRLAVVLGDVTGHGIEATAEMAMAKFVFRTLAREHPDPSEFLARANDIFVGEIELGRFITMTCLLADLATAEVISASAGHPPPRLVTPSGSVRPLVASGLALGVDPDQFYDETHTVLEPGSSVVLYTDGVVEVRCGGDLYGTDRLDRLLSTRRDLAAGELARAVVEDCRSFGGGELVDDCAVVVVKRLP